jgi:hypothetical protein
VFADHRKADRLRQANRFGQPRFGTAQRAPGAGLRLNMDDESGAVLLATAGFLR